MRVTLSGAVAYYEEHDPRGEYVLVVEGAPKSCAASGEAADLDPKEQVELYMAGGMSKMDAIKKCAKERGVPKNDIYKLFAND